MTETLQKIEENRNENKKILKQKKFMSFFVYFLLVFFLYRRYFSY
jgi:hypothetical protein